MASTIAPWNRLSQFIDGALSEALHGSGLDVLTPAANVLETEAGYELSLELPGLDQDDVHVEFDDGKLIVFGERKFEEATEGKTWHRVERRYGKFHRTFSLPQEVDAEKIAASYVNGVLTVTAPKSPTSRPRKIDVKST